MENLEYVKRLVSILSEKRANNHDTWIRVGWCLHNIDYDLLEDWIKFSSKSDKCNIEGTEHGRSRERCEHLWNSMDNGGLEMGSLHRWAKEDNEKEYNMIIREDLNTLIKNSLNMSHYDIAKVVHKMFKHEFKCTSMKNKTFYQFKNHRWNELDGAVDLKKKISENVVNEYCNFAAQCNNAVLEITDEDQRETLIKRGQTANKISLKLRDGTFKSNVLSEACLLFHEGKFHEKLDSNVDLIGFNNGVYDLANHEFRDGLPEDYISFSTGIDYQNYERDDDIINQVHLFLSQVLPIPRVKNYILKLMSSFLSGKTGDEKFHIWTGCHAKDTLVLLANGMKCKVQDVKKGDELMGPDNNPRKVIELVSGRETLYKIIPEYGNEFIVNGGHNLQLFNRFLGVEKHMTVEEYLNKYEEHNSWELIKKPILYKEGLNYKDRYNNLINNLKLHNNESEEDVIESSYNYECKNDNELLEMIDTVNSLGLHYINNGELTLTIFTNNVPLNKFRIEATIEEDFYGFKLDKDHLYMTADCIVHHNCGGNGKSKLIELFEHGFGDYCGKLSVTLITQKRAASNACTPEVLKNKGKRFVTLQEPDEYEEVNVGAMKEYTGGDKVQARGLHKDPIEFKPQWKMVMTANHLPAVSANDRGTWRRITVTEFISQFVYPDEMDPTKEYQFPIDTHLDQKLKNWAQGFIWILIQEYKNYVKNGLKEPPEVIKNTTAYQQESDSFLQFCHECVEINLTEKIKCEDGYYVFKEWFKSSGLTVKCPNKKDFIKNISKKYGNPDSRNQWKGIAFVNKNQDENDNEDD